MSLELPLLNLILNYKFSQEKNTIFPIISNSDLKYMFQMCCSYVSRVVHMYAGIGAALSSQPITEANQK